MKILKHNQDTNIRFVYESTKNKISQGDEHKRFWISEPSKIKIKYPQLKNNKNNLIPIKYRQEIKSLQPTKRLIEFKKGSSNKCSSNDKYQGKSYKYDVLDDPIVWMQGISDGIPDEILISGSILNQFRTNQ